MLEGGERVSDASKGEFVGLYVEVADCVVDKLWEGWFYSASNLMLMDWFRRNILLRDLLRGAYLRCGPCL